MRLLRKKYEKNTRNDELNKPDEAEERKTITASSKLTM